MRQAPQEKGGFHLPPSAQREGFGARVASGQNAQGHTERKEGLRRDLPPQTGQGSTYLFMIFNIIIKLKSLWHFKCFTD